MLPFEKYLITFFYYLPYTNIRKENTVNGWYNNLSKTINYENNSNFLGLGEIKQKQIITAVKS